MQFKANEIVGACVVEKLFGIYAVVGFDERIPIGKPRVLGARRVAKAFSLCYLLFCESGNSLGVGPVYLGVPFVDTGYSDNSEAGFFLVAGAGGHECADFRGFPFPTSGGHGLGTVQDFLVSGWREHDILHDGHFPFDLGFLGYHIDKKLALGFLSSADPT